jgi:hypothetical protein
MISLRMSGMKDTSWVGTKSAPRSCPILVPDYGEVPTLARLNSGVPGRGSRAGSGQAKDRSNELTLRDAVSREFSPGSGPVTPENPISIGRAAPTASHQGVGALRTTTRAATGRDSTFGLTGDGPPIHLLIQITPVGRGASFAAARGVEKVAAKSMKPLLPQPGGPSDRYTLSRLGSELLHIARTAHSQ